LAGHIEWALGLPCPAASASAAAGATGAAGATAQAAPAAYLHSRGDSALYGKLAGAKPPPARQGPWGLFLSDITSREAFASFSDCFGCI